MHLCLAFLVWEISFLRFSLSQMFCIEIEYVVSFFFEFFAVISALMIVVSVNPIHSIFFLILVFCNISGLLVLLQVEFLALVFLVVYVGAIAVLFLFVVMMLNIRLQTLNEKFLSYFPISWFITIVFISEVSALIYAGFSSHKLLNKSDLLNWLVLVNSKSNVNVIGEVIYNYAFHFFELASFILLVAMIGSILLTLRYKSEIKRQIVYRQLSRDQKLNFFN